MKELTPINIGFGNMVFVNRIISIISPDGAPVKRLITEARDSGRCIDASCGKKTKSVIITDSDHVVLSSISLELLAQRVGMENV